MSTYLVHHGIKGQRWGVRRFQNEDGTLTPEGQKRYSDLAAELALEEDRVFQQSIDAISREQTKYGKERVDYWLAKNAYNMSVTEIMTDTMYYRYYDAEKHYNLQRMNDRLTGRS